MVALSVLLFRVLQPREGHPDALARHEEGRLSAPRQVPGLCGAFFDAAGAGSGGVRRYYYTAVRLTGPFFRTLLVLFWALVLESLALEWIALAQRD